MIDPLDPAYMKGFNAGLKAGKNQAAALMSDFIVERMESLQDVPGIGEKTADKVSFHFLDRMEKQEG